jgi:hypothetical protein
VGHPEGAQLFSKARQTPDALGTVVCGERFTILVYGFVFSRVQTKDGKIGYIYSNLIAPDRGGANASQAAARVSSSSAPAASTNAPAMAPAAQRIAASKIGLGVPKGALFSLNQSVTGCGLAACSGCASTFAFNQRGFPGFIARASDSGTFAAVIASASGFTSSRC